MEKFADLSREGIFLDDLKLDSDLPHDGSLEFGWKGLTGMDSSLSLESLGDIHRLSEMIRVKSQSELLAEAKALELKEQEAAKAKFNEQTLNEKSAGSKLLEEQESSVDREEILTKFKALVEKRDKVKQFNSQYQQKLAEYLKRKRVVYG